MARRQGRVISVAALGAALLATVAVWPDRATGVPRTAEAACAEVDCSGHGTCMTEGARAFCFCEDGYAAEGRECVAVEEPPTVWVNRRARWSGPRVAEVAVGEAGHGPREVGQTLRRYPFALSRYVWRGELWCSDFVAWVYYVAGVPLTGGSQGGWLVRNNAALRAWFERHGLYVEKGSPEWATFEPRPGDYVRLHTRSGNGHSAIVRRVDGDTLHTVEGNVGNRVRLMRHRRFRESRRIDGIGKLMIAPAR